MRTAMHVWGSICILHLVQAFLPPQPLAFRGQALPQAASLQESAITSHEVADIINTLFPVDQSQGGVVPEYSERLRVGREAQGYCSEGAFQALASSAVAGELTYGEFPWDFASALIDECLELSGRHASELTFLDIGSGVGRLVIGQALRHPWKECAGVEIVPALHDIAAAALAEAQRAAAAAASAPHSAAAAAFTPQQAAALRALAPCALHLGDILTPCRGTPPTDAAARADVVFCYCSTWPAAGDLLTGLSFALAAVLRKGALVVTTDRRLASEPGAWEFALRATREGVNAETGGASVAYIWEVTQNGVGLI